MDRVRHLFTAAEAARRLGIPPGSIRAWRSKGVLFERGLGEARPGKRPPPLYDRDELIELRDGTRRRIARRPRLRGLG